MKTDKIPLLGLSTYVIKTVLGPSLEEYGEMLRDDVRLQRAEKQIKRFKAVAERLKREGLTSKGIPPKVLFPLLEGISLEDEKEMEPLYENMLFNYVDPRQHIISKVLPNILSQLTYEEIKLLYKVAQYKYEGENVLVIEGRLINLSMLYAPNDDRNNSGGNKLTIESLVASNPEGIELAIYNLIRLSLVQHDNDYPTDQGFPSTSSSAIVFQTKHLVITPLGAELLKMCSQNDTQ